METKIKFLLLVLVCLVSNNAYADKITAYGAFEKDSRPYHGKNCLGFSVTKSVEGYGQCAVDPTVYPYGSILRVEGYGTFIATDCGSGVKGRHIDVCQHSWEAMNSFPTGNAKVTVLRCGWDTHPVYSSKRAYCHVLAPKPMLRVATIHERQSSKRSWV